MLDRGSIRVIHWIGYDHQDCKMGFQNLDVTVSGYRTLTSTVMSIIFFIELIIYCLHVATYITLIHHRPTYTV